MFHSKEASSNPGEEQIGINQSLDRIDELKRLGFEQRLHPANWYNLQKAILKGKEEEYWNRPSRILEQ